LSIKNLSLSGEKALTLSINAENLASLKHTKSREVEKNPELTPREEINRKQLN
jgi:hypothetical protein